MMREREFVVEVREVWHQAKRVCAVSAEEAVQKVAQGGGACVEGAFEYSHDRPSVEWTVDEVINAPVDKAWVEMSESERAAKFASICAAFPVGARVRIVASDEETEDDYVGKLGVVVDHDPGDADALPLIGVRFDSPVGRRRRDGFYSDELEVV